MSKAFVAAPALGDGGDEMKFPTVLLNWLSRANDRLKPTGLSISYTLIQCLETAEEER